ncbi:hypothetical protein AMTRI_Chr03g144620 [Amborella trichopoda]|uniref:Transmembrane protein 45B n=1 Tax=Amborella trichopoda TaxID=13333 RepID=U5D0B3_AMBTC|nr:transmembrane protein 45A [Amborella trichopoda]XP_011626972.1 transmembrane protein 45A [Amborella trichopoda]ERN15675.1 hypothetical protein AMTR_s00048p00214910 [Amborella trichopoda]|eukprot:XP_006854208.1 transmembrane protein 45A [Amborella trichopoda]
MGSFKGHVIPGTLFLVVGIWHLWSSIVSYVSNPRGFRVKAWHPVQGYEGKLKHLELYLVTGGALLDLCIELLYSTHFTFFVNGELNPSHLNDFEHSGMLLMFFIYGVVGLLSEKTRFLPLPEGGLCTVVAAAFCAEYLLFSFHSTAHTGLEGYYHLLLVFLIALCILSILLGSIFPTSFPADLASGLAITLQGLWFYQTAFSLYGPMMPEGCHLKNNAISCRNREQEAYGESLANLQFFGLVFLTLLGALGAYGFAFLQYGRWEELRGLNEEEDVVVDDGLLNRQ